MSNEKTVHSQLTFSEIDGKLIKDSKGREIVLRKPSLLDQYDFLKALGEDANNTTLTNIMYPLMFIAKIDGQVFETPRFYSECRASLQRVGEEGVLAITEAVTNMSVISEKEAKSEIKK